MPVGIHTKEIQHMGETLCKDERLRAEVIALNFKHLGCYQLHIQYFTIRVQGQASNNKEREKSMNIQLISYSNMTSFDFKLFLSFHASKRLNNFTFV